MNNSDKNLKAWVRRLLREGLFEPVNLAVEVFKAISPYQKEGKDAKTDAPD
jgi:hypothetical protein